MLARANGKYANTVTASGAAGAKCIPMALDEGVLQIDPLAMYAVAFPRMSLSIFTRANSARSRLISVCSALTGLLSAPVSLPCLRALTQLNSV